MKDKRILVTGGHGFLGQHVVDELIRKEYSLIFLTDHHNIDLRMREDVRCALAGWSPHIVIHLAADCGGIEYNMHNPGSLFYNNLMMGVHMMHESLVWGVEKFIAVGTVCAYPKFTPVPFHEEDLWEGYPEETNAPYGLAKKMTLVQSKAYRQQYGFNSIFLLPANLYGPGDNFKPESSHVIPALIKKFHDAMWSDTGSVTVWGERNISREFLYVKDAARAIVLALEQYNSSEPVNIGNGIEIQMVALVDMIAEIMGYTGNILWDSTKPGGQPRRSLEVSKAKAFGFEAEVPPYKGLYETIQWYKEHHANT